MKKFSSYLVLLGLVVLSNLNSIQAQNVNVSGAVVGNGTYPTLSAAFTAINGGAQGGAVIVIDVIASTTEPAGGAILNAGTWTSVLVRPQGGSFSISGAATAGLPLIDLNGADNVTIDGLNSGGNALTISNTTISNTGGTSTIRFITDATSNTITRCTVLGSSTMAVATNGGNIYFAAGAVTTGNDNNTVSFCDIGPAGANLPSKGVYSSGTTTTTATNNSGIVITNNNIFDCFNATVTSAAVHFAGGTTDCNVLNNKIYQTATRTQTTGTEHAGIWINNTSSGNNFLVSGNTVGFNSSAGTGTYTFVGTGGSMLVPIHLNVGTTTASNVQGNTVTNIAMSGSSSGNSTTSPLKAIYLQTGIINAGNTAANVIGSASASGAITYTSTSGTTSEILGIYNFSSSSTNISNNIIGGITVSNSGIGAANFIGIRVNTATAATSIIANNQIGGTAIPSIQGSAVASSRIAGIQIDLSNTTITGNVIGNIALASGTGTGSTPAVGGIIINTAASNHTITGNTVSSIGSPLAAVTGNITGIYFATSGTTNVISKNQINSLTANAATATLIGINVATGTATFSNNMIRLGIDPNGVALTTGMAIQGINETTGPNNFYHNSIYIGGTGVGGSANTFALQSTVTGSTRNYINNIFFNARSNGAGTGKHYAIRVGGTAPNPTGLTTNYNDLLATGTGGFIGLFNAIDQTTLTNWQIATGQDANSISYNPQFINPTGNALTGDLHINNSVPTPVEQGGILIAGVTDDIDNQTRSGLTPTDIGADALNGIPQDILAPVISYSNIAFTCNTGDRVFTATITDASGVPTSGVFQPRVYYRKNAGGYFSSQGVLSSGTGTNGVWTFTIVASDMGGLAVGDNVSYFVIAQDVATPTPNIISNPSVGLVAADVNTVTTPPTTPNSYSISSSTLSGTYTVGVGGNYTTLTAAIAAYNTSCLLGPVVFNLIDATYPSETYPITVNQHPDASAINTLTIKPNATATISGSANNNALIRILGNYVTINGSNSLGTTRDLTITNTSVTGPSVVLFGSAGSTPIHHSGILNSIVINGVNTSTAIVVSDATTLGNPGLFTNITIQNNSVQKAYVGIYCNATVTPGNGNGLLLTQNTLNTSGANAIRFIGLYAQGVDGATVSQNTLGNFEVATNENDAAIWFATGTVNSTISGNTISALNYSGTSSAFAPVAILETSGVSSANNSITGNNISNIATAGQTSVRGIFISGTSGNITIQKNNVQGIINTNTGTYGAYGIDVTAGDNIIVKNNFVSNVSHDMTGGAAFSTTFGVFGIRIGQGNGHKIYSNSVNLYGPRAGVANSSLLSASFCLVNTSSLNCDVRNNIFANNMTGGTTSVASVSVYLPSGGTSAMNLTMNNNLYYFGTDAARQGVAQAGTAAGTQFYTTLPTYVAYSNTLSSGGTNDNASQAFTTAVPFVSNTDLHLTVSNDLGANIASVTEDFDSQVRNTPPDIGADETPFAEINVVGNSVNIVDGDVTASLTDHTDFGSQSICSGTVVRTYTIQNTGSATLNITGISLTGTNATDYTIGGISLPATVAGSGSTTFTVTFDPSAAGVRTATVNIANDDTNENPYDYSIQGTGLDPEANVQGNSTNIPDGNTAISLSDHTDFGSTCLNGTTLQRTYTIQNTGVTTLNISSVTTTGTDASMFVISGAPTTIAASSSATFTVTFTPSSTGVKNATVNINSDDCDETIYNYDVQANVNGLPTVNFTTSPSLTVCAGNTVTLSGTGATSYMWTGGITDAVAFTPSASLTYTVTGTDGNGCTNTASAPVVVNPLPIVDLGPDQSQCSGTVMLDAGNPGASYLWSTTETTQTIVVTTTSTVIVTVTDVNTCADSDTIGIIINSSPSVALGSDITQCGGTVILDAGNPGATYVWSPNGETTQTIVANTTGTYSVVATLPGGCTASDAIDVTINPVPTASATNTGPYCAGTTIQLNSVGGSATDDWSGPSYVQNDVQNPTIVSSTVAMSGVYTVTVTNGAGCTATSTTTVVVNANPTANAANTGPYCAGATIQLNSVGGSATDDWSGPSYSQNDVQNPTIASSTVAMSGVYTVTVTNGAGCTATSTTTVVVNANPTAFAANTGAYCAGATIQLNSIGGSATDDWAGPLSYSATNVQNPTIASSTTAMSGVYTVTVTNGAGCTATSTTTVVVNANPTANATNTGPYCAGATIQLNSVGGSATDDWSGPSYTQNDTQNPTIASSTVAMSGVYTVTVTNGASCTATSTTTVVVNANPTANATNTGPYCAGATIQLNSVGGSATDDWSGPSYTQNDLQNPTIASSTVAMSGVYTVTVTNGSGCTATSTTTVVVNPTPTASATNTGPYCAGATIQLNSLGGSATDDWSGPSYTQNDVQNPTISSSTVAMSGVYTVTATNGFGCTATATTTVLVNANPTANATNNGPYCVGSTIQLNSVGGSATDDWSGPASYTATDVQNPTIASATTAMAGVYTVTVTNLAGCSGSATTTVVVNTNPTASATNTGPYCAGATIQLNSVGGSATDDWSGPSSYAVTDVQNPTIASSTVAMGGDYTVTVTDVNGCTATASTTVVVNPLPTPTATNTGPYCVGATIQLNSPAGSSTDDWSGPASYSVTDVQNPTIASSTVAMSGDYTVTVTDVNGCSGTASTTVVVNPLPTPTASNTGPYCAGATIQLNASPSSSTDDWAGPLSYSVTDVQNPTIGSSTVTMSGDYTVTVTDVNGCSATATTTVTVNANPVVNLGADIIQPNPPAVLDAGAGFGSYLWSTSEVTQTISVNTNGTYIVTVTTAGCSDSDTINVNFTSGVMNINGTATTMKLYPNPTSGPFNVQIDNLETTNLTIDILDMTGRVVYTRYVGSVSGNVIEAFDMTHLRMGAYTIRMNANGTSNQLRFVIGQ